LEYKTNEVGIKTSPCMKENHFRKKAEKSVPCQSEEADKAQ